MQQLTTSALGFARRLLMGYGDARPQGGQAGGAPSWPGGPVYSASPAAPCAPHGASARAPGWSVARWSAVCPCRHGDSAAARVEAGRVHGTGVAAHRNRAMAAPRARMAGGVARCFRCWWARRRGAAAAAMPWWPK
jgi:hypothetical protein